MVTYDCLLLALTYNNRDNLSTADHKKVLENKPNLGPPKNKSSALHIKMQPKPLLLSLFLLAALARRGAAQCDPPDVRRFPQKQLIKLSQI